MEADVSSLQTAQRLHPATLLQHVVSSLPALAVLLFFQSAGTEAWISIGTAVAYGLVALPLIVLRYLRFRYRVEPQEIVIERGVFNKRHRSIPIERIQNIAIEQPLLARMVGVAKVTLETAGSTSTEGTLEYVSLQTAHALRQVVRSYQREQDEEATASEEENARGELLHAMQTGRLALSGLFRFSLLYVAVIFSVLQYVEPERITNWFRRGALHPLVETATASPVLAVLTTVVLAVLIGWVTGLAMNINRFFGFRLWLDDDKLHKRHGLLTTRERTVPLGKVQALLVRSNPLMRFFGWYRLEVQTMGIDVQEQGHQVIAPLVNWGEAQALADHVYALDAPAPMERVSSLTIRRTFARYSAALGLVGVVLWYFAGMQALWLLAALPLAGGLAYLQYRYHGYALHGDMLYVRRGFFRQHLWAVPVERMQVLYRDASIFQRRLGLRSLHPDTAGAAGLRYPQIVDLEVDTAERFAERLYARFQRQAALPTVL
jgi:putative membrane protein